MTTFRLFLVFPNQIVQFLPQINVKNINLLPGCKLTTYLLWVHSLNHWTKALTEFLFVIYYAIDSVKIGFVDLVPGLVFVWANEQLNGWSTCREFVVTSSKPSKGDQSGQ